MGEGRSAVVLQWAEQRVGVQDVGGLSQQAGGSIATEVVAERVYGALKAGDRAARSPGVQNSAADLHGWVAGIETLAVDGASRTAGRVAVECGISYRDSRVGRIEDGS